MKLFKINYLIIVFLTIFCGYLIFSILDQSVTIAYSRDSFQQASNDTEKLRNLLENSWQGMSQKQVLAQINGVIKVHPDFAGDLFFKDEEATLYFDQIGFIFEQDKLVRITSSNQP